MEATLCRMRGIEVSYADVTTVEQAEPKDVWHNTQYQELTSGDRFLNEFDAKDLNKSQDPIFKTGPPDGRAPKTKNSRRAKTLASGKRVQN